MKRTCASIVIIAFCLIFLGHPCFAEKLSTKGRHAPADKAAVMVKACPPLAFIRRANYGMRGTNAVMFSQRTGKGSAICTYDPAKT